MITLVKFYLDNHANICLEINKWILLLGIILLGIVLLRSIKYRKFFLKSVEIEAAEIGISGQKIKIKPNYLNMQIAYQLWVEITTRKIGLPIDFEHDVIIEIYNSWYEFFSVTRELIKTMPINQIKTDENTRKIIYMSTEILNEILRPHLTKWQANFRKWYNIESNKKDNNKLSPQQLQQKFTGYTDLISEMKLINLHLIKYKKVLEDLSIGHQ